MIFAASAVLAIYAAVTAVTGGFELRVAGMRIRSHAWIRPALASAALAAVFGVLAYRRVAAASTTAWALLERRITARLLGGVAAVWVAAAGIHFGTFAVGGSDSYGYVSQAALFAAGRITDTVPYDPSYDWPFAPHTLTPLGYNARPQPPGLIVPTYPPGLPLLLAPAWRLSPSAVYLVVPLFAALAVWLCYVLGQRLADPLAGGIAAALLSVSPAFLFQTMQPMSDVPATACWLAALLLASHPGSAHVASAGATASVAILIRPNLAPLAIVPLTLAAWLPGSARSGLRNAMLFLAAAAPGVVALGWIQNVRYGSPLASGYGDVGTLFSTENLQPNLEQYPQWMTDTQTPFIWLSVFGPLTIAASPRHARVLAWAALLFGAGVLALYLPYAAFKRHEWTYLRFLLPAMPLMLALASCATVWFARQLPSAVRTPFILLLAGGVAAFCVRTAEHRHAFELRPAEQRYAEAGEFVRQRLPPNAIVLASQHSGSVRLYGERPILRWDLLQSEDLDRALAAVKRKGLAPFMVIDGWERAAFAERFSVPHQDGLDQARLIRVVANVQIYAFD